MALQAVFRSSKLSYLFCITVYPICCLNNKSNGIFALRMWVWFEGSSLTPRDGFLLALPKPAGSQLNQGPVGNPGEGELLRGL